MPGPNHFTTTVNTIDRLNTASYRFLRRYRGLDNLFSVGEATGDRRQINVKIDHNFSQRHRANVNVRFWTYGDSLSWTKGRHTMKFGGEIRFVSSTSTGSTPGLGFFSNSKAPVVVVGGATAGSALLTSGPTAIANTNPAMTGLQTNDATRARNLLNYLSGSLASVNNVLTDPKSDKFSDYRDSHLITNTIKQREFDLFVKDDFKIRPSLTLNLGVRYEWYGVPFSASGLTVSPVGGGAAFGISGRDFSAWMRPGSVNLSNVTTLEFVGPGSPNPGKTVYPNDWNNFGPAVGFAWQAPWFGKEKTTVRGGYQLTREPVFEHGKQQLSLTPGGNHIAAHTRL